MSQKKNLTYVLLLVLLSISAVALWKANLNIEASIRSIRLRAVPRDLQELNTAFVPLGKDATPFELLDTEGNLVSFNPTDSKLTLLIFVNPTDCSWCLLETSLWKELSESYDPNDLRVLGIITKEAVTVRDAIVFKIGRELEFPILVDEKAHDVSHEYGVTHTPTRILVDRTGKIVDAGYSVHSPITHDLYKKKVAMLLGI